MVLDQQAIDIDASFADYQVGTVRCERQPEAGSVDWGASLPDGVDRLNTPTVVLDGELLVPVGVERDPSLLHEDGGVVPPRLMAEPGEVAFHGSPYVT